MLNFEVINQQLQRPLSGADLIRLNPGVKIVTYDEFHKLSDIDQILEPTGKVIILILSAENSGHWVCLFRYKGILNFFDSYGGIPDNYQLLEHVPIEILIRKQETYSWLSHLMINSRYKKLSYNSHRLQGPDVSTCGRFCTIRLWVYWMSDDEFYKMMNKFINPDVLSVLITQIALTS
jgi:hypothetical protein